MKLPALLLLLPLFLLSGCLFDNPPTGPSRSMNTWLLGQWEHKTKEGKTLKATVGPLDGSRYVIYLQEFNKAGKLVQTTTYPAWISRVGQIPLLTVEVNSGEGTRYAVMSYQLLDPLSVRIRQLQMDDSARSLSSFQLRVAMRRQFKEGTLLPNEVGAIWSKVSEIYWPPDGMDGPQPKQPLRNLPQLLEVTEETITVR